jgi:uncharacterized Ntn-hydrolase superfamily protein
MWDFRHDSIKPPPTKSHLEMSNRPTEKLRFSMLNATRRAVIITTLLIPCLPASASATWSIIVLDRTTGFIGVAGASCTSDVYGIMALIPGTGALMAQAIEHPPAMREAIRLLRADVAPDSVLRVITSSALDSASQDRQYGIATFNHGQIQFTGSALRDYRGERNGDGVLVQGNLLASAAVLDRALDAIQQARAAGKSLEDVVMAGLKAGADAGGDSRCGAQRATSAFLAVAKPGDVPNWPFLTLRVVDAEKGGNMNAVDMLQTRLELWRTNGGQKLRITSETVKPGAAKQ